MRVLVLGAGATGGYFGGRLAVAGRDVTFLVRGERARQLERDGLVIVSPAGDVRTPVATVTSDQPLAGFDVVLLTCKAYALAGAIETVKPAVRGGAVVLPLLNGMRHLDVLDGTFGTAKTLGGLAKITATLKDGVIHHLSPLHTLAFGARRDEQQAFAAALGAEWQGAGFDALVAADIVQEMWEKWVLIAALAGSTCLMRAAACDIVAEAGGAPLILAMIDEAAAVAAAAGHAPRPEVLASLRAVLTSATSTMMASMLRDLEAGAPTEVDHVLGDLIDRGASQGIATPMLSLAALHIRAGMRRYARERQEAAA